MNTNLQQRKIELIQWLSVLDDVSLIDQIADLKEQNSNDWWDHISKNEKNSVDLGIADADAGNLNPHSEARATYEKWL